VLNAIRLVTMVGLVTSFGVGAARAEPSQAEQFRLTNLEHLMLGGLGATARAGRTNTASASDRIGASNLPVQIDATDVKEIKVGFTAKPLLRDLFELTRGPLASVKPLPRASAVDDLLLDGFKLESTVAFGDVLKLKDGRPDPNDIKTDADQTTYSVFISYDVPLEVLWGHARYRMSAGSWGYRDKGAWFGTREDDTGRPDTGISPVTLPGERRTP
jgi:hypothetical protein